MKKINFNGILYILLVYIFMVPLNSRGQQKFNNIYAPKVDLVNYGGKINDFVIDPATQETYFVGQSGDAIYDPGYVNSVGYLGKIDQGGNAVWMKKIKTNQVSWWDNAYKRIIITSDDNLLILSGTYNKGGHSSGGALFEGQLMLHKVTKTGSILAQENYGYGLSNSGGTPNFSDGRSLIESSDVNNNKNYVAAGQYIDNYYSGAIVKSRIFAVKTNTSLVPQWRMFYSFDPNNSQTKEHANCIFQASDKNYYLTGSSNGIAFIIKVEESTGQVIWSHRYNMENQISEGFSITEDCNGKIIVTGSCNGRVMLFSVDPLTGSVNWSDLLHNGIGKNLIKDIITNEFYLAGTSKINGTETFLQKFKPQNCLSSGSTVYDNFYNYTFNETDLDLDPVLVNFKRTYSNGFMFLNWVDNDLTIFPHFNFEIVSTDNQFNATNGNEEYSEYCIKNEIQKVVNNQFVVIQDSARFLSDSFMETTTYTIEDAAIEQSTICESCGENTQDFINLVYCTPLQDRVWWNPCDYFGGAAKFEIINTTDPNNPHVEYNSQVGYAGYTGCFKWQFNLNNTYEIHFMNESGCILKVLHITVSSLPVTDEPGISVGPIMVDCGTEVDLTTYPFSFNPSCGSGYYGRWLDANNNPVNTPQIITSTTQFKLECYNLSNCKRTITTVTFDINPPQIDSINLSYCSPLQSRVWWNPCDYFNGSHHFDIINNTNGGNNLEYNSETGYAGYTGCIGWQFNLNNTYRINFFNEHGCRMKELNIKVTRNNVTDMGTAWLQDENISCPTVVDLNNYNFSPFSISCNGVGFSGQWLDAAGNVISTPITITSTTEFTHECYDLNNCTKFTTKVRFVVNYQEFTHDIFVPCINEQGNCVNINVFNTMNYCGMFNNATLIVTRGGIETTINLVNPSNSSYLFCLGDSYRVEFLMPNGCKCIVKGIVRCLGDEMPPMGSSSNINNLSLLSVVKSVYPNPSLDLFTFEFLNYEENKTCKILIMDLSGKIILNIESQLQSKQFTVDLSKYASGIYTAQITYGDSIQTVKLVKE